MEVINRQELSLRKDEFFEKILDGCVFIHPTDTIYGLGCDARNSMAVGKLREMKRRSGMPFSVIAPSKSWIYGNCVVEGFTKEWVEKLPGPYTLLLRLSNVNAVSSEVNLGADTLGVRIPKHWFSKVVEALNIPVVTTSANISGHDFMTSIEDLDSSIMSKVDFAVYEGEKKGKPSSIVNLVEEGVHIIQR